MKKDFKDLILATTSQAIGDGHFGSGSNRDVFTVDKTNTDMDENHSPIDKILLHGRNLFTRITGNKKESAKINLEMISAKTYKLFASYSD